MSQGLQAIIAAAALTLLVGVFFAIQILFRRFLMKDRAKDPKSGKTPEARTRGHHKRPGLRKKF